MEDANKESESAPLPRRRGCFTIAASMIFGTVAVMFLAYATSIVILEALGNFDFQTLFKTLPVVSGTYGLLCGLLLIKWLRLSKPSWIRVAIPTIMTFICIGGTILFTSMIVMATPYGGR